MTGANLNPWPEHALITTMRLSSGLKSITK
jgi:hypothetical protein